MSDDGQKKGRKFATRAVHVGEEQPLSGYGDVVIPIHMSTTYARSKVDEPPQGYEYARAKNPTRIALEKRLATLENGFGGLAFSSGVAAESTAMFLLKAGDNILACNDIYGGSFRLFNKCFSRFALNFTYADFRDEEGFASHLSFLNPKMIWIESPTNPLMRVFDIAQLSRLAHENDPSTIVVVDNTFASPYFQRPLDLGADVVVHSTTKYVGGHSDVIGGALIAKDKDIYDQLRFYQKSVGAIAGPFDSFLTLRGLKTLHVRMDRHQENAMAVARYLEGHELVKHVYYPGLESHPQYELAKRQMSGFSGMISFELRDEADPIRMIESTKLFALAESLGGVESLIEHPASMTHASIPKEERIKTGLSDGLIRLSVGIEDKDDLISDLEQALHAARRP